MTLLRRVLHHASSKTVLLALFMFCAAPPGIFMALTVPPGQVPDEPAHMARAAGLLHGAILAVRHSAMQTGGKPIMSGGVKASTSLFMVAFGATTVIGDRQHVFTQADEAASATLPWIPGRMFAGVPNTATYFPAFYAPAAAGFVLARHFGGSPYDCLRVGRLFMLLAFLLTGAAAIGLAAFGEAVLLVVLLLPMTLFLASSLNPDGLMAATACLGVAALTRDMTPGSRPFGLAVVLLVLIALAKLPYALLLGFLLLPLRAVGKRVGIAVLAALPVLLWAVLLAANSVTPFGKPPYRPGPLWAGAPGTIFDRTDPAANLHILLAAPARFITLPLNYFLADGLQECREGIGILGLFALQFPDPYYLAWGGALAAALLGVVLGGRPPPPGPGWRQNLWAVLLLLLVIWVIPVTMYLNWTNVGADQVDGVQGRYFILLLPFLVFIMPRWPGLARLPAILPALPALALGVFDLGYLPAQLVRLFYLH